MGDLEASESNSDDTEYGKIKPTRLSLEAMAKDHDGSEYEERNIDADLSYSDAFVGRDHFQHSGLIVKS